MKLPSNYTSTLQDENTAADNKSISVLIVDDEKYIRKLLADLLEAHAVFNKTAEDGKDALDMLSKQKFDVVITDINMPNMDGFSLLKNIKQTHPKTAVVVMTAYSQDYSIREALALGAEEYVSKPFQSQEVIAVIERANWRNKNKRIGAQGLSFS
ncbi:hypothetical protein CEE37_12805 [candidate division LCP-89 bacterium B3_LCP]|uniref:Response regulatory domain-containing protein n=1 Tax=candidate division LCP-89 bacterium B3_LCP TaxID=2012998 RepID=A0A532UTX2_UNCL8|nr:MAG: hypothetical protein CEE37_12805 [candidate division LCP-89 bacterium B3_LCP]